MFHSLEDLATSKYFMWIETSDDRELGIVQNTTMIDVMPPDF